MRRMRAAVTLVLVVAMGLFSGGLATADTNAPSAQTFVLSCGGATVTFVSPTFQAKAAQIVGTTGVGVLQRVVVTDSSGTTVLFEQPSFSKLAAAKLTTCMDAIPGGTVTLIVLTTPQS
jgi:hypothetical protein